jgi:PPOX class probable F420-dependent enzyme
MLPTSVQERLQREKMIWFTTVRPDGRPHNLPVWFLWEGESILLFSKPKARKIQNIRHNQQVMLALDNTHDGQSVIALEGKAELLKPQEVGQAIETYGAKYRDGLQAIGVTATQFTMLYAQPVRVHLQRLLRE